MTYALPDSPSWEGLFDRNWSEEYAFCNAEGQFVFVLEDRDNRSNFVVVRNDLQFQQLPTVEVPELGKCYYHDCVSDPAFIAYKTEIDKYDECRVLRYRQGKRITLKVLQSKGQSAIMKILARGATEINRRIQLAWNAREQFNFLVAQPLQSAVPDNIIMQCVVPGEPLSFNNLEQASLHGKNIALSLQSLHSSRVNFDQSFGPGDQNKRSDRYIDVIAEKFPVLSPHLIHLVRDLQRVMIKLQARTLPIVPVHGSPHSKQWLSGSPLGLIDFDRAAMAHAELDLATFLTEWDYEPGEIGSTVKEAFINAYGSFDPQALGFYRSHKHLAKAFKAAKNPDRTAAYKKTKRNLLRAISVVNAATLR